jgi:hypothetical protein
MRCLGDELRIAAILVQFSFWALVSLENCSDFPSKTRSAGGGRGVGVAFFVKIAA